MKKSLYIGSLAVKTVILLFCISALVFLLLAPTPVEAAADGAEVVVEKAAKSADTSGMKYIAASIAVGIGSLAGGIAVAIVGSAAMGAIAERPELAMRALIYVALAEGIAIYGVAIAVLILVL